MPTIDILKRGTLENLDNNKLSNTIYFRDIFDASFNTLSGQNKTIDIKGINTNTHKISVSNNFISPYCIDLSKVHINEEYVIDISSGYANSNPFKINRPTFNNLDISYNDFKIDENNKIVNQGDKQVTVKWDYSGNINVYELELSCNKIPVHVNKRTLTSENFKGGNDYNNIFSYTDIKKKQEFTWDISFNDISGNNEFDFLFDSTNSGDFFKIILKDKDPSNNIITDSSAVDISSAKFNIIAPQLKKFKIQNENSININTTKIATQGRHIKIIWENDQTGKPDLCGNIYDLIIELSNNTITIPDDNINIVNNIPSSDLSYNWFIPFDNDISGSNYKIILKACNSHFDSPLFCDILNHVKPIESTTFDISYINPIHITYTNTSNEKETIDLSPLNIRKDSAKWFRGIPSIRDLLYIMDTIDISWNETLTKGYPVKIDISGLDVDYRKNILTHIVSATDSVFPNGVFKKNLDLSLNGYDDYESYFNNHYMFVISRSQTATTKAKSFFSPPFKINRPVFNNINYKIQRNPGSTAETFDISNQEIAQGDRITIDWDYSGNITDVDLELSSNVIDIQNKPFSHLLENYDSKTVTYSNGVGTFTWDVSYNEISGNNFDSDFPDDKYFKIILKDKSDKSAYTHGSYSYPIKDCSAVDISSSKFNIIAPRLGKVTLKDENNIDVETTKKVKQGRNVQIHWDYSGNINSVQLELSNNTIKKCIYNIVGIDNVENTFTLDNVDDTLISPITFKSNSTLQFENIKPDKPYNISIDQTNKTIQLYESTDTTTPLSLDVSYNVMDISFNHDSLTLNTVENLSSNNKVKLFFNSNATFTAGDQRDTNKALINGKEYEIAQIDTVDNKIWIKETNKDITQWIDISTNALSSFNTRKGQSNMGDFNIHLKKEFTNDFPDNNFTLEKECGKLYELKNLTIFPSIVNDGTFTYNVPVNKDLSGSGFKIVLNPLTGGFKNIDISGITKNSLLDYEFDISHNKFFKIEVGGDDTNETISFKHIINSINSEEFTLESIYGLKIGDEVVFNNQINSWMSSDTITNFEPLKTYKIKTITKTTITLVPGNTVNVNDVVAINANTEPNVYNSMFEKKIKGNNFLLFYKRKNILRFNISREALQNGYTFKLINAVVPTTQHTLTNFGVCNSIRVNLYILELEINWIFEEKSNKNQNFDIPEGDYYLLLTDNKNSEYDISSNIFRIKYYGDCKDFPFGRFNNSQSNLKIYPFLDNGNTIQPQKPIFNNSVSVKKSSRMSYISRNRFIDR